MCSDWRWRGAAAYRATYVLIQFGHNDQPGEPGHSTDLATTFPANIARYAGEVKALGGIPVQQGCGLFCAHGRAGIVERTAGLAQRIPGGERSVIR